MRAVLIGMNNPINSRPEYVLWPDPVGCAGWRLWQLIRDQTGCSKKAYLDAFDRLNLVPGKRWDAKEARRSAEKLMTSLRGRRVVLLGQDVRQAFRVPRLLFHPQNIEGVEFRQLPHPSGLNLWYNEAENKVMAGTLLAELGNIKRQEAEGEGT